MIIADAHAHFYSCYHPDDFFFSAFENFRKTEKRLTAGNATAVMFLTDISTTRYFDLLRDDKIERASNEPTKQWSISSTDESCSLRLAHTSHPEREIILISGEQIVTAEKLEVLAIGCHHHQDNGAPVTDTVHSIFADGGLVILPWGVGKWLGKRGRIIEHTITKNNNPLLFLGDNGSRPGFWPVSSLNPSGKSDRPRLLSGTDPLPLAGEEKRVGSFGSVIHGDIDLYKPFTSLREILSLPNTRLTGFGALQPALCFVKQQVALRMTR